MQVKFDMLVKYDITMKLKLWSNQSGFAVCSLTSIIENIWRVKN